MAKRPKEIWSWKISKANKLCETTLEQQVFRLIVQGFPLSLSCFGMEILFWREGFPFHLCFDWLFVVRLKIQWTGTLFTFTWMALNYLTKDYSRCNDGGCLLPMFCRRGFEGLLIWNHVVESGSEAFILKYECIWYCEDCWGSTFGQYYW